MSKQLDRKILMVNQRRGIKQHFTFDPVRGVKSKATSSIVTWGGPGKGVQGESVNSQNNAGKFIVNRNWKPL